MIHIMSPVQHLVPSKVSVRDMSCHYRQSLQANTEDTLLEHPKVKCAILESALSCRSVIAVMHASLIIEKLIYI